MKSVARLLLASVSSLAVVIAKPVLAIEMDTSPQLTFRAATVLADKSTLDFNLMYRAYESFEAHDREIAEVRYGRKIGDIEWMGAYHVEVDRRGAPGNEHRVWLQARKQFALANSGIESSLRLEGRYFDFNHRNGERLRWLTRWVKPLTRTDQMRVGYELVYNLNDITGSIQNGDAQDRLIGTWIHNLGNGDRMEFEWQMRYLHITNADNRIQNQLQLTYIHNF